MTDSMPIRVLLADDHALLRVGLAAVLSKEPDFVVVGEARDGLEAVELHQALRPDLILIDLQMPGLDGVQAIMRIRATDPLARAVVLTTYDSDEDIDQAMRAGASGYLLKDASAGELVGALRDIYAGRTRVAPAVGAKLAERITQTQLSVRELSVVRLLAAGKTNKELAAELSIGEATVRAHLSHIFEKLAVTSRTEAVVVAAQRGILRLR